MIKISDLAKSKVIELMSNDGFSPQEDFIRAVTYTHLTLPTNREV